MAAQPPLRIVHCFRSPTGGVFRHIRDLTEAQLSAGHQVGVICDSSTGDDHDERQLEQFAKTLPLGLHRLPMARGIAPSDLMGVLRTRALLRVMTPDVVHCHTAKGGVFGRLGGTLLAPFGRKPARFYSPHGGSLHFDPKSAKGKLFFAAERTLERASSGLIFVCDYERQTYAQKVGTPRCASNIVYNGLPTAEFEPALPDADASDFLFIGMMRDLKGPDLVIEALADIESATATMVGEGPDRAKYEARVSELGLTDRISFHDSMPARDAFKLARTVVVPSRAESFPYIVLEAMAAHKPVIATDVGGISEMLEAPLVAPDDADEIRAAMKAALMSPPSDRDIAERASSAHERFSVDAMSGAIETVYRTALS
ncbi:MAG: glycosyltransferase family 4 protein [Pseudomonadota bacterium]